MHLKTKKPEKLSGGTVMTDDSFKSREGNKKHQINKGKCFISRFRIKFFKEVLQHCIVNNFKTMKKRILYVFNYLNHCSLEEKSLPLFF